MTSTRARGPLTRAFLRFVNMGVPSMDQMLARSVMASNRFFLLAAVVSAPWVLAIAVMDPPATLPPALTHLLLVGVWCGCLVLNRRQWHLAAAIVGLAAPIAQFVYLASVFSVDAGFQLPLLTVGALAFVVLTPQQWRGALALTAVATAALVWTYAGEPFAQGRVALTEVQIRGFATGNVMVVVIVVSMLAWFNNYFFVRQRRHNQRLLDEAQVAARTDALTGVLNRRGMAPVLADAAHHGQFCVAQVDLDRFKKVNDRLGHGAGDVVLAHVARTLVSAVGGRGTVARWGGEEFLVVVPGADLAQGLALMESARAAIQAEHAPPQAVAHVTVSIGLAAATPGAHIDQVLGFADAQLYRAKAAGRNVVRADALAGPPAQP
ncbi:diguanylate cyclase [Demequina sp.]|uniref:GGDEF domain-containing protein n=1 Tax=Demequina sp. TaxID=2050685 RepID=UPI003A84A3C6